MARALMFQGTGSDVGKSLVVAGLCRLLARRGIKVAPFKAQNMSNNAAVAHDGGEIGRAQWLQAFAAGVEPSVHMNPVLLKPQSDRASQIVVQGKIAATMAAAEYHAWRASLLPRVLESYRHVAKNADIVLAEGAGSPAEINLRQNDIANMGFARAASCPVILIGDIERGGVIASLVGTHTVLPEEDRTMIRGFLINKFRGDPTLFDSGMAAIGRFTGWQGLGLIPHHPSLMQLPQEDSLALGSTASCAGGTIIAVLACPHIANFDDLDPLAQEPHVRLIWVRGGERIPAGAKLVVIPGSKATIADLAFLRRQKWDEDLQAHLKRGGHILGICGGYQMLGRTLSDPHGIEGPPASTQGLGLLAIDTLFTATKTVCPWQGRYGEYPVNGYEIHCGASQGADQQRPFFDTEGARSADNRVWGTYVHGLFTADDFRHAFLAQLGAPPSSYRYGDHIRAVLDGWADILEAAVSIDRLLALAMPARS